MAVAARESMERSMTRLRHNYGEGERQHGVRRNA
uniref:Uncharacterized protein n=1 Tax=Arundo donax TaxID=35708 RepID=A0A0A8Z000_ARUDO